MKNSVFQPKWKNRGITTKHRFNFLLPLIKDKKVLDIGCVVGYRKPNWIHNSIVTNAKSAIGIDIDQKAIQEINEMYPKLNVIQGNACAFELNDEYEVIHAGELIEHIDNFNGFLTSVKKHLKKDGLFVFSTPNVETINHVLYNLTGGLKVNDEHVCWFCDKTLTTLLVRNGFKVEEIIFFETPTYGFRKVLRFFLRVLPKRLTHSTLIVKATISK